MGNFNYVTESEEYKQIFTPISNVLIYGKQYKKLSSDAKIAYSVLRNRAEYSIRNHWVDEEHHVYLIYTNEEMMDLLNCSKSKIIRVKRELQEYNLLQQKTMHFNPQTGRNEPNRLYLGQPDVNATDVYLRGEYKQKGDKALEPHESIKNGLSHEMSRTLEPHESIKNGLSHNFVEKDVKSLEPHESIKNGHNIDKEYLEDTKKIHKDTQLDFSSNNYSQNEIAAQNKDLLKHAAETNKATDEADQEILSKDALKLLGMWCKTPKELYRFEQIILNAKKAAVEQAVDQGMNQSNAEMALYITDSLTPEQLENSVINSETYVDLQKQITNTIRKTLNVIRRKYDSGKPIQSTEGYIFGAFKNLFSKILADVRLNMAQINN